MRSRILGQGTGGDPVGHLSRVGTQAERRRLEPLFAAQPKSAWTTGGDGPMVRARLTDLQNGNPVIVNSGAETQGIGEREPSRHLYGESQHARRLRCDTDARLGPHPAV